MATSPNRLLPELRAGHGRPLERRWRNPHGHRLRVEPVLQGGPTSCTNACLRMVLGYYGYELAADEIDDALFKDVAGCSFNTDVARIARRHGFAADCYGYNLYLTDPEDGELPQDELLGKLREEQGRLEDQWYAPMLRSIVAALDEGVRYMVQRPSWDTIAGYLARDVPVIAVVSYAALHGVRGNPFAGHDVLVTGHERRKVYLIDPLDGAEHVVDREHLMFAIASRSAIGTSEYLTAISPS